MVKEDNDKPKVNSDEKNTAKRPSAQNTTSPNLIAALVLAVLSLFCFGPIAGIPAIIISYSEIKKINEKKAPDSDLNLAKISMVLGIIGTAFYSLIILTYLAIFFLSALGILTIIGASTFQ